MRVLVTGAAGQLGQALILARPAEAVLHSATHASLDIADAAAVDGLFRDFAPELVINAAAFTKVDDAERAPEAAARANSTGPAVLAAACRRGGAWLTHVSTDYVFDGDCSDSRGAEPHPFEPADETAPQGVYARSKLAGEQAVLAALPEAVVVRTAWVYTGGAGNDFVAIMRRLAAGDGPVDVVDDQTGSPTYVADLAAALLQVADFSVPGPVLHAANEGAVSRFGLASAVFEECGADPARVRPVSSAQFPRPAPRPGYSALGSRQSVAAGLRPLRPWRAALVAALAASGSSTAADRPIASTRD